MKTSIIIFFTLTIFIRIVNADKDPCLSLADSLYLNQFYDQAITEYMRYLYFSRMDNQISVGEEQKRAEILFRIGISYRNRKNWQKATDFINRSIIRTKEDSLRDTRKLSLVIIRLSTKEYSLAEIELLRLLQFSNTKSIRIRAYFFLAVCYVYQFKWQEADEKLKQYVSATTGRPDSMLNSMLYRGKNLPYKSPDLAKWLSTFIPGCGQIYAGDRKNGINALAINLLTGYLLVDGILDQRFQDLILSHMALFWRFYQGNRANAEKIAELNNERLNKTEADKIIHYLEMNW